MKRKTVAAILTAFISAALLCSCTAPGDGLKVRSRDELLALISERTTAAEKAIAENLPGIVCWGDSLTSGPGGDAMTYPKSLQNCVDTNIITLFDPQKDFSDEEKELVADSFKETSISIPVVNMGVGGEDTNTILGRSGAVPYVTTKKITIPAEEKPVKLSFSSENGKPVAPLLQGNAGIETVTIAGIEGKLTLGSGYSFTRLSPGEETEVPKNTVIHTSGSEPFRTYLPVVFMGQNKGFTGYDELTEQINQLINHQTANGDRAVVIGLHTTTPGFREDLEGTMTEEFGAKYLNIREYMSGSAIYDAGITPTDDDLSYMEGGFVPPSLLSGDMLHFNAKGYEALGKYVYYFMDSLGYFDGIEAAFGQIA